MKKKRRLNIFTLLGELCFAAVAILAVYTFIKTRTSSLTSIRSTTNMMFHWMTCLIIPGTILIVVGSVFPFLFDAKKDASLVKNGTLTFGKLLSIRPTGTSVNNQPQLALTFEFETADDKKITTECLKVIPITFLGNCQPGALLPIRYDKDAPEKITLDFTQDQATLQQALNRYMIDKGLLTNEMLDTAKRGQQGQAVIVDKSPTGNIIKGNPEISLTLRVTKANGEQYEAELTRVMLAESIDNLSVGKVVDILYLPENPESLVIKSQSFNVPVGKAGF
jgi:hypothetical protein